MTVPFVFFLGLDEGEMLAFQALQTGLNFVIVVVLFWFSSRAMIFFGKQARIRPVALLPARSIIITALEVEAGYLAVALSWYLLVMSVLVGLVVLFLLLGIVPFSIVYLRHFGKDGMRAREVILLHAGAVAVALVASMFLTSGIFTLAGMENRFIFGF